MKTWRHIVWDMGGTLFDTYPSVDRTLQEVCQSRGCSVELAEVSKLTRVSIAAACAELARRCTIAVEVFTEAYADLKNRWRTVPPPVMPGAREVLAETKRRGGLNLVVTHRDRRSAQDLLCARKIAVDDLICAPDGHPRKPDPAMHRLALDRYGLDPAHCLAVGDRVIDAVAASQAGMVAMLLVTPGLVLDSGDPNVTAVIEDLRQLL